MTASTVSMALVADAPAHQSVAWHSIDWHKATQTVRRLQVRIMKATRAGKWRRVRSLQRLLTHSFSARAMAVMRVTENRGKKTAGVDGEVWDTPQKKAAGVERLRQKKYRAQPLRRVYIPKRNGKRRPLGIPCKIDRAHQALYLLALDPIAETTGDPNSYGFRRERSPADAIQKCFQVLYSRHSARWILEGDIRACFDKLSHEWMLTHIPVNKQVLRQWLKAGYMEDGQFHATEEGSPQGGIISPVIANMVLDGLEQILKRKYTRHTGKKVHLIRFADDFIITGVSRELLENEVKPLVEAFLAERGLELSPEKTTITHIDDGFDFLGVNMRKYGGKFLTKPSKRSQKSLLDKVRTIIRNEGAYLSAYGLIQRLNPVIRGWANYHRHWVSSQIFSQMDYRIFEMLWRWAVKRHGNKSKHWIYHRYFVDDKGQCRPFHMSFNEDGKRVYVELFKAARLHIVRHHKIRQDAHPYDPQWELYLERRIYLHIEDDLWDRPRLRRQWRAQQGICPICQQLITINTGWDNHHITFRVYGGSDDIDNKVLLHPNCHRQFHNPSYSGPSLRPSIMGV